MAVIRCCAGIIRYVRWSLDLPRQVGEFVLLRLSQIARSAHAPLGSETCKPNLYVIVASNPERFLKLWWRHDPRLFYTREGVAPVKRFIETSRPVRVWYNASISGGDNGVVLSNLLAISTDPGGGLVDYPIFAGPSILGSRTSFTVVRNISSALVVVDPAQVSRLNIGQLVDYIGLVGLAEINLDQDVGEAPTILKVFAAANTPPPAEMTVWDQGLAAVAVHDSAAQSGATVANGNSDTEAARCALATDARPR